jgi:hypothetical protein
VLRSWTNVADRSVGKSAFPKVHACHMSGPVQGHPLRSAIGGALFCVGWAIFIDRIAIASQHCDPTRRPTFIAWVPGLLATLAAVIVNITRAHDFNPSHTASDTSTQAVTLAVGWALSCASSCVALMLLFVRYAPGGHHEGAGLGVGIVLQTCAIALSSVTSWSRYTTDGHGAGDF